MMQRMLQLTPTLEVVTIVLNVDCTECSLGIPRQGDTQSPSQLVAGNKMVSLLVS
jgi:hypothetical protein